VELAEANAGSFNARPTISRKDLKGILASRNAQEDDKTRKSIKSMQKNWRVTRFDEQTWMRSS